MYSAYRLWGTVTAALMAPTPYVPTEVSMAPTYGERIIDQEQGCGLNVGGKSARVGSKAEK